MRVAFMAHRISREGPTLATLSLYPHLVTTQSMEDRFYGTLFPRTILLAGLAKVNLLSTLVCILFPLELNMPR
jgi:hypothetical protein